jgi:hypothetical protein
MTHRGESAEPASSDSTHRGSLLALVRWLGVLTVLLILLSVIFGFQLWRNASGDLAWAKSERVLGSAANSIPRQSGRPGPWGRLQYRPILISQPREIAPSLTPLDPGTIAWQFPRTSRAQLFALFASIALPESLQATLASMAHDNPSTGGLTIRPTPEVVLGMKPEIRAALYGVLARFSENSDQANAFRFEGSSPDEWFAGSSLSDSTRQIVDPLIYRRGNMMYFADSRVVEQKLASPDELWLLLKALSRCRTLLVALEISQESDVESLVAYWGRGGRMKDVRPILESLSSAPSPETLNIAGLLPALPRRLLYTYPDVDDRNSSLRRNCYWTSFNFFNAEPDDRFADPDAVNLALADEYHRVAGPLLLGDVMTLYGDQGRLLHSAVYVADIVFTKNGRDTGSPWVLMKIDDVQQFYPVAESRFYRRNDL